MVATLITALMLQQGGTIAAGTAPQTSAPLLPKVDIKDAKVGEGDAAQALDVVEVDYTGKLLDGTQFDSSVGRAKFVFQLGVGNVIKGWDQGVLGMKPGGTRELTIPHELAYGERGAPPTIPPKSTLKFDVTLHRVLPRAVVKTTQEGSGNPAKIGEQVQIKYKLLVKDGQTLADSSGDPRSKDKGMTYTIGSPVPPGQLFAAGLNQGLVGIKAGEKRTITIHPSMAFGEKGLPAQDTPDRKAGSVVPPNATLIFEIEALPKA